MPPPNAPSPSSAGVADLLSTLKNLVQSVGTVFTNYLNVQGQQTMSAITGGTVVKTGAGRVCVISVTAAGSTTGMVYDSNQTSVTTRPVYVIPDATGIVVVNMPVSTGIVVIPGTDQQVAISYS